MKISDELYALYLQFFTYGVVDIAPQYSLRTSVTASVVQALGINDGKLCGKLKPGPNPTGDVYKVKCRATLERDLDFAMASSTPTAKADPAPAPVVMVHNTFNIKDGDTNAIVAAFNRVTEPAKPVVTDPADPAYVELPRSASERAFAVASEFAAKFGQRLHIDTSTYKLVLTEPSTYYLDKRPKSTPDSAVDQRPTPMIEQQWHDFGHWLVTAFQPGKVDEAAVLHPGGKYESGPEFCRRALQLALDRGAFNHRPRSQTDEQVAKLQAMAFVARHANIPYEALVAMSDAKFASTLKLTEEMVAFDIEAATKPV